MEPRFAWKQGDRLSCKYAITVLYYKQSCPAEEGNCSLGVRVSITFSTATPCTWPDPVVTFPVSTTPYLGKHLPPFLASHPWPGCLLENAVPFQANEQNSKLNEAAQFHSVLQLLVGNVHDTIWANAGGFGESFCLFFFHIPRASEATSSFCTYSRNPGA